MLTSKIYKEGIDWGEYSKLADWCNENNCMIEDKGDYYEVCNIPGPTVADIKESKYIELRGLLASTDYKQNEYLDGRCTADEYAPIKAKRVAWTDAYHAIEQSTTVDAVKAITYPGLDN